VNTFLQGNPWTFQISSFFELFTAHLENLKKPSMSKHIFQISLICDVKHQAEIRHKLKQLKECWENNYNEQLNQIIPFYSFKQHYHQLIQKTI